MLNFRVDGKVALVTGCSRGIGMGVAEGLAEAGADIIGVSNNLPSSGSEVGAAVEAAGRRFYPYAANLADRASLREFIKKVRTDHPRIDILINNAGGIMRKSVAEHPDKYWDTIIHLNLDAPFILTRAIGKDMLKEDRGRSCLHVPC